MAPGKAPVISNAFTMNAVSIPFAQVVPTRVTSSSATVQVKPQSHVALPDGTCRETFLATLDLDRVDMLEAFCSMHEVPCGVSRDMFGEEGLWIEAKGKKGMTWAKYKSDRKFYLAGLVVASHTSAVDKEGNPLPDGKLFATRPDGSQEEVFQILLQVPELATT